MWVWPRLLKGTRRPFGLTAFACVFSSKGGTLSKRTLKKALPEKVDEVRAFDLLMPSEDLERNRQIIQWMMEGEKEACRKKNLHG